MRIFLTGATGFIGSYLVPELIAAGHTVLGLSRSETGAQRLRNHGAVVVAGSLDDLDLLIRTADAADAVIHAGFTHDPNDDRAASDHDRRVIEALGGALAGSDRPLVITSGTALVRSAPGEPATELDEHVAATDFPRAATEEAADALVERGIHAMVMRLPQVHDTRRAGRITWQIQSAREHGRVVHVDDGTQRLPAVHVRDAVHLYRRAVEDGRAGAKYHAVAEEGIALRDICAVIAQGLGLPHVSISAAAAREEFGRTGELLSMDLAASSALTRAEFDWSPSGPQLLDDLTAMDFSAI
jgi:nucleoside-diphosphate-sugar epimerase